MNDERKIKSSAMGYDEMVEYFKINIGQNIMYKANGAKFKLLDVIEKGDGINATAIYGDIDEEGFKLYCGYETIYAFEIIK